MLGFGLVLTLAVLPGCGSGRTATLAPLPPDQVVFRLTVGSNGFTSRLSSALTGPDLVVYGDGRVIRPTNGENSPGRPTAYDVARVDPLAVARFADEAEEREVVDETTDFGDPPVTDMPSTSVLLHGRGGPRTVSVYAFDDRFDDGLTRAQRQARGELAEIVAAGFALPADAARAPLPVEQVRVVELEATEGGTPPGSRWPGPDPGRFLRPSSNGYPGVACGTLSGPNAGRVYAAARDNPGGVWTVDGQTRVLAVTVLLPGTEAC